MSEYRYYEFQALDQPLDETDRKTLRALSSRARITATSLTNSYEWGDFKGDPVNLMERWFDLHLYLTNWGTRRLMFRFPQRLIDRRPLDHFLHMVDCVELKMSGDNLIVDILREELEPEDDWDDGSGWLAALTPLRADVIGGDLRLFYLLWLMAVEDGAIRADVTEPLPGIGPMTGTLDAFARFFGVDQDLVAAASEAPRSGSPDEALAPETIQCRIAELPDQEKNMLLVRLAQGDPHVANALRVCLKSQTSTSTGRSVVTLRTAGELRARAAAICQARQRKEAERLAAERKRRAAEQERARRLGRDAILMRGEGIWDEIETEIERRNASGYEKASGLLLDLKVIADEQGTGKDFSRRLRAIRERHARKQRFIERLRLLG